MKKDFMSMVMILLLCCATNYAGLVKDQYQESYSVGQVIFSDSVLALWQEFTPTYDNVSQIHLYIWREAPVTSATLEIRLLDGEMELWSDIATNSSISNGFNWIEFDTGGPVAVEPGQSYKIELTSQWEGKQLNWFGTNSSYAGGTSNKGGDFDYVFRTYAEVVPEPITLSLFLFGSFMLRKKQQC